jgi:hypothetical protein
MLFSCYGVTANCNMSPIAFAILFENENTSTWRQFWQYVLELCLCMDSGDTTIITDQNKRQKNAIAEYLCSIGHFHCSWQRFQNIIRICGSCDEKTVYSALWIYKKLLACRKVCLIQFTKDLYFKHKDAKDLKYLNFIGNHAQYPAARCDIGENIYMYHCSASMR